MSKIRVRYLPSVCVDCPEALARVGGGTTPRASGRLLASYVYILSVRIEKNEAES